MSVVCNCGNKPCDETARFCHWCGTPFENEEDEPWDREIDKIPCIQIQASDWLLRADVQKWVREADVARWGFAGDIFTVYDYGEGPDCPGTGGSMPHWLWNTIERIVKEHDLNYCVVRLMNVDPIPKRDPIDTLLRHIDDLADENECQIDWEKGTFGDLLKNIVAAAEDVKKARKE